MSIYILSLLTTCYKFLPLNSYCCLYRIIIQYCWPWHFPNIKNFNHVCHHFFFYILHEIYRISVTHFTQDNKAQNLAPTPSSHQHYWVCHQRFSLRVEPVQQKFFLKEAFLLVTSLTIFLYKTLLQSLIFEAYKYQHRIILPCWLFAQIFLS